MPLAPRGPLPASRPCAADICVASPCVTPETDNASVLELFARHKDLVSLPVVENGLPFGLINRHIFLSQMTQPFRRELYDRKSCIAFMDKAPLVVDAALPIEAVAEQSVAWGDKSLVEGFIITRDGLYLGLGMGLELMRAVSETHARQHRQIVQSIEYASVIQSSMLATSRQAMRKTLPDSSLVWEPRDTVGGDFHHFVAHERGWLAVLADCTGHGVPGAFMTLILASALDRALTQHGPDDPAILLQTINRRIKDTLGQLDAHGDPHASDDGCDALIVAASHDRPTLRWSSAHIPAFVAGPHGVRPLAPHRMGVGYAQTPYDHAWPRHETELEPGELLFAATDGLSDQIGGGRGIAFGKRRLLDFLRRSHDLPCDDLARQLSDEHKHYQGTQARRDDLTFLALRR